MRMIVIRMMKMEIFHKLEKMVEVHPNKAVGLKNAGNLLSMEASTSGEEDKVGLEWLNTMILKKKRKVLVI
jgi:hypothetical protein